MPLPLPKAKREAILADVRARSGQSARQIGKTHDVSDAAVRRLAKEAGIEDAWSRDKTKKATEANAVDHQAKLAILASRSVKTASAILDSFEAEDHDWGRVSPHTRAIAFGILADKARELAAPDEGVEAAKSLLDDFMTVAAEASRQLNKAG